MKEVLKKRKLSCCEKIYDCVNCSASYYEFDVNNYTLNDVYVVASYKQIEPSKIKVNIGATGGGGELDMDHKDIKIGSNRSFGLVFFVVFLAMFSPYLGLHNSYLT